MGVAPINSVTGGFVLLSVTSIIVGLLGASSVVVMALRDHAKRRAMRRGIIDDCIDLLDQGAIRHNDDAFPTLEGRQSGRFIRAEFVPDTMTIRRLPQLWLSLTRIERRPGLSEFAALVRPAGTEFYALTTSYAHRLEPPPGLPYEILIQGSTPAAQQLLDRLGALIGKILSDPKVKEIGVTENGLRLVWQAGEGRRGEHLLLRQSVFDDARVAQPDFARLLAYIDELSIAITSTVEARAA